MENEMQNRTENSPVIPPVKQGRSLEYAAGIDGFGNWNFILSKNKLLRGLKFHFRLVYY